MLATKLHPTQSKLGPCESYKPTEDQRPKLAPPPKRRKEQGIIDHPNHEKATRKVSDAKYTNRKVYKV